MYDSEAKDKRPEGEENWEEKYGIGDNFAELFEIRGMKNYNKGEEFGGPDAGKKGSAGRFTYPEDPQDKLDLHGFTTVEADALTRKFITEAKMKDLSFVIIVVGKGYNSEGGKSKLKPVVVERLNELVQNKRIRNYESAKPRHGGFGAIYVYLR
ncbi:MAG: Smr/MutS family protein [Candidatus Altimarinota bacterium]